MTDRLVEGFKQFRGTAYEGDNPVMPELVKNGQNPDYLIISCVDSRANPGTILSPEPGTFFAFKSMGAIVRPYQQGTALASTVQFAIEHMKVPNIILLGHTHCGAIKALADDMEDPEISSFVQVAKAALDKATTITGADAERDDLLRETEKQTVLQSMQNLMGYPAVKKAIDEQRLEMKGWIFEMGGGNLLEYNQQSGAFEPLTDFEPPVAHHGCGCDHS